MKKLSYVLILILSVFIFYSGFSTYSADQIQRMNVFATSVAEMTGKQAIGLNLQVKENLVSDVLKFCEESNSTGIINIYDNTEGFIKKNISYLYASDSQDVKSLYLKNEKKAIDFQNDSGKYYTTDLKDKNAYNYIDYLNRWYYGDYQDIYEFHPLNDLSNDKLSSDIITLYLVSDSRNLSKNQAIEFLKDYQEQSISEVEIIPYSMHKEELFDAVFLSTIFGIILIFVFIFLKDRKEIVIWKMLGNDCERIFLSLYGKHIVALYGIFVFIEFSLFLLLVGFYRPCTSLFLSYLIDAGIKLLMSLIAIGMVLLILIKSIKSAKYLKQNGTQERKTVLSLALKGLLIFSLFPVFTTNFMNWIESVHYLYLLNTNKTYMSDMIVTNGVSISLSDGLFYSSEMVSKLYEYMQSHGGIYEEFDINKGIQFLQDNMESDLNIPVSNEIPYIVVNNNYLKDYTIHDESGKVLDFEQMEESCLLVPENYSLEPSQISYYSKGQNSKVIYIEQNLRFIRHMPYVDSTEDLEKINPIIFVDSEWTETGGVSTDNYFIPIHSKESVADFKNFLIQNNMEEKVKFYLSDSYFVQVKHKKIYDTISLTILIALISLILFVYQLQSIVIFLFEKRYYLSIQYLLGKSFYERYSLYLSTNIFIYLSVIIFHVLRIQRFLDLFVIGSSILVIDLIFTILTLKKKECTECVDSLKGAR